MSYVLIFLALSSASSAPADTAPADTASSQPTSLPSMADITSISEARSGGLENGHFLFGSYGRIGVFTNQLGKEIPQLDVVNYIPRLEKDPYLELYFGYAQELTKLGTMIVMVTPAFAGDPFHYTGQFQAQFALRNAYVELRNLGGTGLYSWIGSRMYRGDDCYLLDFWPLDNLNTLGGAIGYTTHGFDITVHGGASKVIGSDFFNQQIQVADPTFGSTTITTNNRQHLIGSLKLSYDRPLGQDFAIRFKLYGEAHSIAAGAVELTNTTQQTLPGDSGWVLGGQISAFHHPTRSFVHLFLRQGTDLGAYNSLDVPFGLNAQKTTHGAGETLLAISAGAVLFDRVTLGFGAYYRAFHVALEQSFDNSDRDEYVLDGRVTVQILRFLSQGFELSYQRALPHGIQPDLLRQISPEITKFSIFPALVSAPDLLPGVALRFIYTYAATNDDSKYLYATQDLRYTTRNFHFFGVQAEWLFDKSF